jgi:phage terminase small subunit
MTDAAKKDFTLPFAELPPYEAEELPELTDLQQLFVEQYLIDLNGRRAAMRCGSDFRSAAATASNWLKRDDVRAHVEYGKWEIRKRLHLEQDRVVKELMRLGLSNVADYQITDQGYVELAPGAPQDAMAAVAKIKRVVKYDEDGNKTITTDLALWDKPGSLKQLADYMGMNVKRVGNADGSNFTVDQLRSEMAKGD